jgi:hypothetical protein
MGYFRLPVTTGNASLTQLPKHFAFLPPPAAPLLCLLVMPAVVTKINPSIYPSIYV